MMHGHEKSDSATVAGAGGNWNEIPNLRDAHRNSGNYPVCFFRAHLGGQELRSRLQTTG